MNEKNISLNKKIISLNENFCLTIVHMSIFSCNDRIYAGLCRVGGIRGPDPFLYVYPLLLG